MRLVLSLLVLIQSTSALAISEASFDREYDSKVTPHFASGEESCFHGRGKIKISYRVFLKDPKDEKGAVVLVPGRSESSDRYAELIYDLSQQGYSVYVLDHRGQGRSGRMTSIRDLGYVQNFSDYVEDLRQFVDDVVKARPHSKLYLLAHSMGGAVSALYLAKYGQHFNAVALSAPMFEIDTGKYSNSVAYSIATTATLLGQGAKFALGKSGYNPNEKFEDDTGTHSLHRFKKSHEILARNPTLAVGGPSYRWVQQGLKATREIRKIPGKVGSPVLLFQAEMDLTVKPGGQNYFCSKAPDCRIVSLPGSFHETLMETDAIRNVVLENVFEFFAAH
jgi:lysophospholipase